LADHWPALALYFPAHIEQAKRLQELVLLLLDDFKPTGLIEDSSLYWRVFFSTSTDRNEANTALNRNQATSTVRSLPMNVQDEKWAERSQAELRAVRIGQIVIAPPWDIPASISKDASITNHPLTVIIEPSIGFGTGHHASTRLCIHGLQRLDLTARTVLDLGTGSGVLAIVASTLGATSVRGLDRDATAIATAAHNLTLNETARNVSFHVSAIQTSSESSADVVVANLTGAFFSSHSAKISSFVVPGGYLICSGITKTESPDVLVALEPYVDLVHEQVEDEWVGLIWQRDQDTGRTAVPNTIQQPERREALLKT
tara:strand:- start:441 stop:1385 length:945 start_codon:yes stop_codon:yes gene_type:complete